MTLAPSDGSLCLPPTPGAMDGGVKLFLKTTLKRFRVYGLPLASTAQDYPSCTIIYHYDAILLSKSRLPSSLEAAKRSFLSHQSSYFRVRPLLGLTIAPVRILGDHLVSADSGERVRGYLGLSALDQA